VMQALYHSITGRREKLAKEHNDHYIIRQSDIRILIEKIEQTLQQFNYQAASATVTVFHYGGEKITYSSVDKFNEYDVSRGEPIGEISVEVEFMLALPQVGRHQSYKITTDIRSYVLYEDVDVPVSGVGSGYREEEEDYCIRATIEYVDYVVARSFVSTIADWVNGLEKSSLFPSWWTPRRGVLWRFEELLTYVGAAAIGLGVANLLVAFNATPALPILIALVGGAGFIGFGVFQMLFAFAFRRIGISAFFPYIIVNKGDERNYGKFVKRRERASRLGWLVFGSGVLLIAVNVLSKLILHKLGL
jgi:hypothetical protein